LSRGYKGGFAGPFGIVTDGQNTLLDVRQAGDEPYFLSKKLKGIPVLIGRKRFLSGQAAVDQFQAEVVFLDDGFQHLSLRRDVNLLLIDSQTAFGNGWMFPRGLLRESPKQAKRADAVILTKADFSDNISKLKEKFYHLAPGCPIFSVRYVPIGVWDPIQGSTSPLEALRGKRILAFTGIGDPNSFHRLLENSGARIAALKSFRDHYWYRPEDFQMLLREGSQKGVEALVTTEKDSVRLEGFPQGNMPLWVLSIRHEFLEGEQDRFEQFLWSELSLGKKG
jgi:tetraacyldisaccharide 4'-kinase